MTEKMVGQGSQYAGAFVDAKGDPLAGAKTYKLHLPPDVPAKDFWSFVVYDNQTRSMLQTDQQYPSISSQKNGLQINEDKSVDVWFGPQAREQLGADRARQRLERTFAAIWATGTVVRQNVEAWGDRVGKVTCRAT
jgi:Protein of unknown function (DUF1214)